MAGNKIEIGPQTLRSTTKKVENSATDTKEELKRFQAVIEGPGSTQSSEVKDRFLQDYQKNQAALAEMADQYTETAEDLLWIADELGQTEEEISSQIQAVTKG